MSEKGVVNISEIAKEVGLSYTTTQQAIKKSNLIKKSAE
jgi:predicted DNA binding protein